MEICLQAGTSPSAGFNLQCLAVSTAGILAKAKLSPSVCLYSSHFSVFGSLLESLNMSFWNLTVILPTVATYYF